MMKTTRVTDLRLSTLSIAGVCAAALLFTANVASGASLTVSSSTVQESGDTARVCIALSGSGEDIAATQNDLVWDASCLSLVDKCEASSGHGKQLMSNQRTTNELRAIVISLQDTKPIPPNSELYCCTFRVELASGCCSIGLREMSASDPEGRALGLAGRGGQVCVAGSGGSAGRLEGGTGNQQEVVSADLGSGAQQQAAPAAGQPQAQGGAPQAAGSGNTVLSGGAGGVQGGTGGVPAGGGAPGAQPGVPGQPGQIAQPQAAAPADSAPAAAPDAGRAQEPAAVAQGTPTTAPAATTARPTSAPVAAQPAAPAAKPATPPAKTAARAAAPAPAATPPSSGCNCEISPTGVGFEASGALLALGLLLWARRRRL